MSFVGKRKKTSTTDLPAALREELGLGEDGRVSEGAAMRGGVVRGARRGVVGRKEARKADRRDRKGSRGRAVPSDRNHRPQQIQCKPIFHKQDQLPSQSFTSTKPVSKGKGKDTTRDVRSLEKKTIETKRLADRSQRKHVGEGEATPLQRLMKRNQKGESSRSRLEPPRKKQRRVPLSAVEQQEEDEIAWLEAHLEKKAADKPKSVKAVEKRHDETETSDGVDGGEDGLDDLLDDLDRFYPGMYDGSDDASEEDESNGSSTSGEEDSMSSDFDEENQSIDASLEDDEFDEDEVVSTEVDGDVDIASTIEEAPIKTVMPVFDQREEEPVRSASVGRYIPPALRQKAAESASTNSAEMQKLRRQAKGLLNRLGEGNLESIVMEMVESLYSQYSRANVTDALTTLIIQTITSSSNLVDTFVILYAALIASLHRLVGLEFGAHFLQTVMEDWQTLYRQAREKQNNNGEATEDIGKEAKNLMLLIANLYNLGVVACPLMFDIVKVTLGIEEEKRTRAMTEVDVELLLRIVKTCGSQLRHDDPTSLKTIVQLAQQSSALTEAEQLSSRSRFMLEALEDLKNNKSKANSNQGLEQQSIARMKKFLSGLSRKRTVRTQEPLRVGLKDLQDVDKRGKWWLVGAAWSGYEFNNKEEEMKSKEANATLDKKGQDKAVDHEAKREGLVQVARQHGMNTSIRQDIFVILVSSQDYLDALEKLQSFRFKKESQRREIIRVLLHCIGSEVTYNPFYVILASRLAVDDIGTRFTLQYCLWDFLREMGEKGVGGRSIVEREEEEESQEEEDMIGNMSEERIANTARAYGWWIAKGALSLSAMKVIDFTRLKDEATHFLQQLFIHILLSAHASSPTLTLRLSSSGKVAGPFSTTGEIDQTAKESIESVFVKGTLSNVTLCQGLLFFFERNLKPKDCIRLITSMGATDQTKQQLLWSRGVAKQIIKVGAHSTSV